jgi:hypothetical protein
VTRPTTQQVLLYRLFGWRLGPEHREWVYADLKSKRWVGRQLRVVLPAFAIPLVLVFVATGSSPTRMAFPVFAIAVLYVALRNALMVRALRQQGLTLDGEPDPKAAGWYADDAARHRFNVSGAVTITGLYTAVLVYLSLTGD